jgi:hypothetical protein
LERSLAKGNGYREKQIALFFRAHKKGMAVRNEDFSIIGGGNYAHTSWQGSVPSMKDRNAIKAAHKSGAINQILQNTFYPIYYSL